jgi:membrane protein implicated in regulation of membrane protease activity
MKRSPSEVDDLPPREILLNPQNQFQTPGIWLKCPGCGTENPDGHTFCGRCGATLLKPVDIKDDRLKEAKGYILKAIANRKITDRIVSWAWILIIILILIGSGVLMIIVAIASASMYMGGHMMDYSTMNTLIQIILMAMSVAITAIFAYLAFVFVRRQNEHFARDRALREGIILLLRTASDPSGRSTLVMNEFAAMSAANGPKEEYHDERMWALLMLLPLLTTFGFAAIMYLAVMGTSYSIMVLIIPLILLIAVGELLAMLYMFYFLGKQMYEHDERWQVFEQSVKSVMTKLRWPPIVRMRQTRLEKREFAIYLIVTIFISPFVLYWWYTLIKDPNTHFESQWEFEDRLAEIISK